MFNPVITLYNNQQMQNSQKRTLNLPLICYKDVAKLEYQPKQYPVLIPIPRIASVKKIKHKKPRQLDEPFSASFRNAPARRPSRWSQEQDRLYVQFLKSNVNYFDCENLRRTGKVFMHLSKAMQGTRTANQCKSHHQKMQKGTKSGNVREIVSYLEKKYSFGSLKVEQKAEEQWQNLTKENPEQTGSSASEQSRNGEVVIIIDLDRVSTW